MIQLTEEVFGIKYMFSTEDRRIHLMVLRMKKAGYESYCRDSTTNWTTTGSTEVTCNTCKKVTINVCD